MANDVSAWLAKLDKLTPEQREALGWSDEDSAAAKKEHLLERDYTQSKQKLAALTKIQEQYPQATPEQIAQLVEWYLPNSAEVNRLWTNRDRLVERQAEVERPAGERRKWRDAEAADLYETARLREVFEDLGEDFATRAVTRVRKDWYEKDEVPRLNQVASAHLATAVDLMKLVQQESIKAARDPQYVPMEIDDVLREAAARGERDFRKVAANVATEREALRKTAVEEGRKLGLEEGRKAAPSPDGPSGPMGGGTPAWRPSPADAKPKTREDFRASVLRTVEAKHGQTLPL